MKGCVFVLLLLSVSGHSFCQNLIPNPSFTDTLGSSCFDPVITWGPNNYGLIEYAPPWTSPWGTVDLYRPCPALGTFFTVPNNDYGFQYPRTGSNYAGMIVKSTGREYIESPLLQTLQQDSIYLVEFYTVRAGPVYDYSSPTAGINRLGVYFSADLIQYNKENLPITYTEDIIVSPHLQSPEERRFVDTANWEQVCWLYTAKGFESFMTTGFFADPTTVITEDGAYHYFDDFTVQKIPYHETEILLTSDTLICESPFSLTLHTSQRQSDYLWSTGETGPSITVSEPGMYVVETTVAGCLSYDTVFVTLLDPQEFTLGPDIAACPEDFPYTLAVPEGQNDYLWNTGATTPAVGIETPGSYWVRIDSECGILQDSITLTQEHPASPLLQSTDIVCQLPADYPLLLAGGFTNYELTGFAPQTNNEFTLSQPGSYLVTAGSICGSYTDTFTLNYLAPLDPDLPAEIVLCDPTDTLLRAAPGYDTYLWSDGSTEPDLQPADFGDYQLIATNACESDTVLVVISPAEEPLSVQLPSRLTVLLGTELTLEPTVAGTPPLRYHWSPADKLSCFDCPDPVLLVTTEQVLELRVTDRYGCEVLASVKIEIDSRLDYYAPTAVSPNADGINDRFEIYFGPQIAAVERFTVYDRWGGELFSNNGEAIWRPERNVLPGSYVWHCRVRLLDGSVQELVGSVGVLR